MLEILVLSVVFVALATLAMAKHRKWNPRNFISRIRSNMQLGTLAASTLIATATTVISDNEYRVFSYKATWSLSDFTSGEGPINVGVAHGDYTAAEIEEWYESQDTMTRGDLTAAEQGNRMCRQVGTFPGILANETLNDGKPIRTKLNWAVPDGSTLAIWAYNTGNGTLTTSAEINTSGQIFARWT